MNYSKTKRLLATTALAGILAVTPMALLVIPAGTDASAQAQGLGQDQGQGAGTPDHTGGPPDHAGGPPDDVGGPPDGTGGPPDQAGPPDHAGGDTSDPDTGPGLGAPPSHAGPPSERGSGLEDRPVTGPPATARERAAALYNQSRSPGGGADDPGDDGGGLDVGGAILELDDAQTRALLERGWERPEYADDDFENHGQRVRTLVGIATALGHGAHVGALQANFGTPQETGLLDLQARIAEAEADNGENLDALLQEFEETLAAVKPGIGPQDEWALVNLDVNGDGRVTQADLEAVLAGEAPNGNDQAD